VYKDGGSLCSTTGKQQEERQGCLLQPAAESNSNGSSCSCWNPTNGGCCRQAVNVALGSSVSITRGGATHCIPCLYGWYGE